MRPSKRSPVNKQKSAGRFKHAVARTSIVNMRHQVMRGGIRF